MSAIPTSTNIYTTINNAPIDIINVYAPYDTVQPMNLATATNIDVSINDLNQLFPISDSKAGILASLNTTIQGNVYDVGALFGLNSNYLSGALPFTAIGDYSYMYDYTTQQYVVTFNTIGGIQFNSNLTNVHMIVVGGGGAGGGCDTTATGSCGAGGGGGGAIDVYTSVTNNTTTGLVTNNMYYVNVGMGGNGVAASSGTAGGSSYFVDMSGTALIVSTGGQGGTKSTTGIGGAGGSSTYTSIFSSTNTNGYGGNGGSSNNGTSVIGGFGTQCSLSYANYLNNFVTKSSSTFVNSLTAYNYFLFSGGGGGATDTASAPGYSGGGGFGIYKIAQGGTYGWATNTIFPILNSNANYYVNQMPSTNSIQTLGPVSGYCPGAGGGGVGSQIYNIKANTIGGNGSAGTVKLYFNSPISPIISGLFTITGNCKQYSITTSNGAQYSIVYCYPGTSTLSFVNNNTIYGASILGVGGGGGGAGGGYFTSNGSNVIGTFVSGGGGGGGGVGLIGNINLIGSYNITVGSGGSGGYGGNVNSNSINGITGGTTVISTEGINILTCTGGLGGNAYINSNGGSSGTVICNYAYTGGSGGSGGIGGSVSEISSPIQYVIYNFTLAYYYNNSYQHNGSPYSTFCTGFGVSNTGWIYATMNNGLQSTIGYSSSYGASWSVFGGAIFQSDSSIGSTGTGRIQDYWGQCCCDVTGKYAFLAGSTGLFYTNNYGTTANIRAGDITTNGQGVACSSDGSYVYYYSDGPTAKLYYMNNYNYSTFVSSTVYGTIGGYGRLSCSSSGQYVYFSTIPSNSIANLFISTNYGVSYTSLTQPGSSGYQITENIVCNSTGDIVYICNYGGNIFTSTNYGSSWSIINSNYYNWTSIACNNTGNLVVSCNYNGYIYYSYNYGNKWQSINTIDRWAVVQLNPNGNILVCGISNSSGDATTTYTYYLSNTNEISTSIINLSNKNGIPYNDFEWCANQQGMSSTGQYILLAAYDTYTETKAGRLYYSTNYGSTFTLSTGLNTSCQLRGPSISSNGNYGVIFDVSSTIPVAYYSSDYGKTFSKMSNPGSTYFMNHSCISDNGNTVVVACSVGGTQTKTIFITQNASSLMTATWLSYNPSGSLGTTAFCAINSTASTIYVSTTTTLWKSTNTGTTWTNINTSNIGIPNNSSTYVTAMTKDGLYIIVAQCTGGVYLSNNSGTSFSAISGLPYGNSDSNWAALAISTSGQYMAGGFGRGYLLSGMFGASPLYYSTNFGKTWSTYDNIYFSGFYINAIQIQYNMILFTAGGINNYTRSNYAFMYNSTIIFGYSIFNSTIDQSGTASSLLSYSLFDGTTVYCGGGGGGGSLRYSNTQFDASGNPKTPLNYNGGAAGCGYGGLVGTCINASDPSLNILDVSANGGNGFFFGSGGGGGSSNAIVSNKTYGGSGGNGAVIIVIPVNSTAQTNFLSNNVTSKYNTLVAAQSIVDNYQIISYNKWISSFISIPNSWIGMAISNSGYIFATNTSSPIYFSSNYGNTYNIVSSGTSHKQISISSSGQYGVVCHPGPYYIYTTSNYGNTWIQTTNYGSWDQVSGSSSGQYVIAATYGNGNFYSSDYGTTFIQSNITTGGGSLYMSSSGQYCVSAFRDGSPSSLASTGQIYYSNNYGQTWTVSNTSITSWNKLCIEDNGIGYAVNNIDYVYNTTDYGQTWTTINSSGSLSWSHIVMDSNGQNLLGARGSIGYLYSSSNYGQSWTQTNCPYMTYISNICISRNGQYAGVCGYNDYIYVTPLTKNTISYSQAVANVAIAQSAYNYAVTQYNTITAKLAITSIMPLAPTSSGGYTAINGLQSYALYSLRNSYVQGSSNVLSSYVNSTVNGTITITGYVTNNVYLNYIIGYININKIGQATLQSNVLLFNSIVVTINTIQVTSVTFNYIAISNLQSYSVYVYTTNTFSPVTPGVLSNSVNSTTSGTITVSGTTRNVAYYAMIIGYSKQNNLGNGYTSQYIYFYT